MGDYNQILLKRQFEVKMSVEAMTTIIAQCESPDFSIVTLGNGEYQILSDVSLGVGRGTGIRNNGIKIYASLRSSGPLQTAITLKSRFRGELYVTIIFGIILIVTKITSDPFPLWICFLGPITTLWFWFIYRYQEKKLADDFEYYLEKQPRMGWPDLK